MATHAVGLIGYGNMGKALAVGLLRDGELKKRFPLTVYARNAASSEHARAEGAKTASTPAELAAKTRFVIVAVKPFQVAEALASLKPALTKDSIVISVAAGVTVAALKKAVDNACPVARVMPNTFVAAGQGLFALCLDDPAIKKADREALTDLFSALGRTFVLPEKKMSAFSALAGCGPAYAMYFAEALIEAGVTLGFSRTDATDMSFSLLEGASLTAKATGLHPSLLREQVTSPGGMTIAGTNHLDRAAVRGNIVDAVLAAWQRGLEMEKE